MAKPELITPDLVDRINELVDHQLDGGEPEQGYSFGDPTYPRCPHCSRHWHGLPLTERIAAMYDRGEFDEEYSAAADDSRVLCEGAEFIGPIRAPGLFVSDSCVSMGGSPALLTVTCDPQHITFHPDAVVYTDDDCESGILEAPGIPCTLHYDPASGFINQSGDLARIGDAARQAQEAGTMRKMARAEHRPMHLRGSVDA